MSAYIKSGWSLKMLAIEFSKKVLVMLILFIGPGLQIIWNEQPSSRHDSCVQEKNCTDKFPAESAIRCSIVNECSRRLPPEEISPPVEPDLRPFLTSVNIASLCNKSFNFSFTVDQEAISSGRMRGVEIEFKTLEKGHVNQQYNHPVCRHFRFESRGTKTHAENAETEQTLLKVELSYPCIGLDIHPGDFRLTVTPLPSSQQLVYDVKWTYWSSDSNDSVWIHQLVAVAAVKELGDVHVVFEPTYPDKRISGVQVALVQGSRAVVEKMVPLGNQGSIVFHKIPTGYYIIKLSPVGRICDGVDCTYSTFRSLPVWVDSFSPESEGPCHYERYFTAIVLLLCLLGVAVAGYLTYKRLRVTRCLLQAPKSIFVISFTMRPLESELVGSFKKLLETAFPSLNSYHACAVDAIGSSTRTSGKEQDESSHFFPANSLNTSPTLKDCAVVAVIDFGELHELTSLMTTDTSSIAFNRRQNEIDFFQQIGFIDVKPKNRVLLPVGNANYSNAVVTALSSNSEFSACESNSISLRLDVTESFCDRFPLPQDTHQRLCNVHSFLHFLQQTCAPRSTLITMYSLSRCDEWTEFDFLMNRVLEPARHDTCNGLTDDSVQIFPMGVLSGDDVETVYDEEKSTTRQSHRSQNRATLISHFLSAKKHADAWEKDSFSNMTEAFCTDLNSARGSEPAGDDGCP